MSDDIPSPGKRHLGRAVLRGIALGATWLVLLIWLAWACGALLYDLPPSWPRGVLAGLLLAAGAAVIVVARRWKRPVGVALLCLAINAWWLTLRPSNDRDWQPDVAVAAHADIEAGLVTIHGVRSCDYRTETDYTAQFGTRTVQLSKLSRVDLFLCYWGSPWLAHPILSFCFEDADPICFSIETRKEKGETYSTLGGLYREYELIYVVAEERDVVRLRTDYRVGEDVYLYRLDVDRDRAQALFLDYLSSVNQLHEKPSFYNVLTSNCTTNIRTHFVATERHPRPWDWRILLPGKLDELIRRRGGFVSDLPLDELKRRGHVNPTALRIGDAADFSRLIRVGVPGFEQE